MSMTNAAAIRGIAAGTIIGPTPIRTPRLIAAENMLQTCIGKRESKAAIREYLAAKREAHAHAARAGEITAAIAKHRCNCGRDIIRPDATVCDRCQRAIDGPPKRHRRNEKGNA